MTNSVGAPNILQPQRQNSMQATAMKNDSLGLTPGMKLDDTLHIGFQNVGGLPELSSHHKNDSFRSLILEYECNIFGIAETNLNWSALPAESQFYERTRNTWNKAHSSIPYNWTTR
jgi:hypothetical protein